MGQIELLSLDVLMSVNIVFKILKFMDKLMMERYSPCENTLRISSMNNSICKYMFHHRHLFFWAYTTLNH